MKKLLLLFGILCALNLTCTYGFESSEVVLGKEQKKINEIGFNILNANQIPYRMVFYFNPDKKVVNAVTHTNTRTIVFYKGLYLYMDSDEEIAAILSHEISHGVDSYQKFHNLNYCLSPKKYEIKADKNAVDYLVKAGYNPLAYIVAFNKIAGQIKPDFFLTHPTASKRLMYVYEYIYNKYPYYLVNNDYIKNPYYQNFLVTSYKNREKLKNKIEKASNKKIRYE